MMIVMLEIPSFAWRMGSIKRLYTMLAEPRKCTNEFVRYLVG